MSNDTVREALAELVRVYENDELLSIIWAKAWAAARAALAAPPNDDTERVDALQRECDRSPDGRIILRAPPGRLREYIDNARNPKPLGGKDE